jgi:hypothetical protein
MRDGVQVLLLLGLGGALASAVFFGVRAMSNRSQSSTMVADMMSGRRGLRGQLWSDLGSRDDFTAEGWRYRNRGLSSVACAIVLLVALWLT